MVKIGIISDIHGNISGLTCALRLLENDVSVDEIVCNGDLVDRGVAPGEVVQLLRSSGIPTVQGNHDRSAPSIEREMRGQPHLRDIYQLAPLSDVDIAYLEGLPTTLRLTWAGVSVLVAHGAPWDVAQYVRPNALPKLARRVASESGTEVTLLGHTHEPMHMSVGSHIILNSGSLSGTYGRIHGGRRTCGVLELPSKVFTVYDVDTAEVLALPQIKQPPD